MFRLFLSCFLVPGQGSLKNAFYFISFLVPVALVTSWYFNNYLIPYYLLRKKYKRFIILSIFTVIISLDVIMIIVFIAFILIARYQPGQLKSLITQYYSFPAFLYLTVIANTFFNVYNKQYLLQRKNEGNLQFQIFSLTLQTNI